MNNEILYLISFAAALLISAVATPLCRFLAVKFNIMDNPISAVKTHKISTPYLGGIAIALGCIASLLIIRMATHFPDGTLRSLRGIIFASVMVMLLGFVDDAKFKGLGFKSKLVVQFLAAAIVVFGFDIRINFLSFYPLSCLISIFWIMGITNAFNIIDIMDGLSSGISVFAAFAFLFISLPTEMIYVNFCAAALAGAVLGFMPYNFSKSKKIFMGDTGSLFIGFVLASLAMGTSYTAMNEVGLFAPLLILAVPIYETGLVSLFRMRKGKSPFLGSKDHYALRLEKMGFSRKQILIMTYAACIILSFCAFLFTKLPLSYAMMLLFLVLICMWIITVRLASVKIEDN
ncbi:MAG: undecaprenyl/decaprenyl-phosphate alpha-N-acetylglucosaminyl 1-phosphate transferase [Endomicrobium sp.]|jgi:UDP-GlcNAc:undecaprenyl-phosphate GlcNAc-1-phosphate transferase|nr:undecaprenyl/decaprenyl-phosphate alpha-N-acetylglucosaminyl 1-phosphate transferase [Endomicrobium sp.]